MIDNYDSFTFNLVQYLRELGSEVLVFRNDAITPERAERGVEGGAYSHLVISPGPGGPREAGVSMAMIRALAGRVPVLGVCLGHQAMAEVFGGKVTRAPRLMHGKPSVVRHDGRGVYAGLPNPIECGRYHSLCVAEVDVPAGFVVSARTEEGEVMGMRHERWACEGVQFHPESVLTPEGKGMIKNFLAMR
jgi:anthranilate synthase/aminodeoxychorismate synthase-like glutamine amidotransferase